jgi:uncharacterized protein (DUF362 family)
MAEPKQKLQLTAGHYITIIVLLVGIVTTWAGIKSHISDEIKHIDENEVVLTIEEYKSLLTHATTVKNEFGTIKNNERRIIEIEKKDAVDKVRFDILYLEVEGLEDKVSRNYLELNNKIDAEQ